MQSAEDFATPAGGLPGNPASSPLVRNNVRVAGNPDASRCLVFVHGIGTEQGAWNDVVPAFATDYRIVLLDNVGAGGADPEAFVQDRYLSLDQYAKDLLEVLRHLRVASATVVGHSAGAMIAALAAVESPAVVSRLVLIGASPRYLRADGYPGTLGKEDIDEIYRSATGRYVEWVGNFARSAMQAPDRPPLGARFAEELARIPRDRLLTILCSVLQTDYRDTVARLRVPTLVIQTRSDPFVPLAIAQYLHDSIAGSELAVIDAAGHLPHVSAPEAVIAAMAGFLRPIDR